MRPIKFKAWDDLLQVMIEGFAIYAEGDHLGISAHDAGEFYSEEDIEKYENSHFNQGDDWLFIMNNFQLLQFTGLTDNYRKEIYDGDLLKSGQGNIFQVLWSDSEAGWIANCLTGDHLGPCELKQYMEENLEVIGNIYENPELKPI